MKTNEYDVIESCLVDNMLNKEILNILMEKLSTKSEETAMSVLVDTELINILIEKHMNVYQQEKEQNVIVDKP